jgi:transcriptional regulator with XRE-family HTH domain
MDIPRDIGRALVKIRAKSGVSQQELARRASLHQSHISRIENGDALPTESEMTAYLSALDGSDSSALLRFLSEPWSESPRPQYDNPDRDLLTSAENSLRRLKEFAERPGLPPHILEEAQLYRDQILAKCQFLARIDHSFAFIGAVHVGKSTAICFLTDLLVEGTNLGLERRTVLETGKGYTTVCEVNIRPGPDFGLIVEPKPDAEIYTLVSDFCASIWSSEFPETPGVQDRGVSPEIQRALRNMAGLTRSKQSIEGRRTQLDPARDLARSCQSLEEFQTAVLKRLALSERKKRQGWYVKTPDVSPKKWLQERFASINNGRDPEFPLPAAIEVIVGGQSFFSAPPYEISVVDTQGLGESVVRPDLRSRIDDPRTILVFCSSFGDAPSSGIQNLLGHVTATGGREHFDDRSLVLVLPRGEEARIKDDAGEMPETDEEGYLVKRDQAQSQLQRIGFPDLAIEFLNIASDAPASVTRNLIRRLILLRQKHAERLTDTQARAARLIDDYSRRSARKIREKVRGIIGSLVRRLPGLRARTKPIEEDALLALGQFHASTVWATTRRLGEYYNLNLYSFLGSCARSDARDRSEESFYRIVGKLDELLEDREFDVAWPFLHELRLYLEQSRERFLHRVQSEGEDAFRPALRDATDLWARCVQRWGQGPGYKADVVRMIADWFRSEQQRYLHDAFELGVSNAWNEELIEPVARLCAEVNPEVDTEQEDRQPGSASTP